MDRSFQGLLISLIIHGILFWLLMRGQPQITVIPSDKTEIEIVEKESTERKRQYFAPKVQNKEEDIHEQLNNQADFIAELSKRVKKQMRARKGEKDLNGGGTKKDHGLTFERGGQLALPGEQQDLMRNVAIGSSSLKTSVPGVEVGAFTALNQQQFTYYSFFSRLGEQIGNRWRDGVIGVVRGLQGQDLAVLSKKNRETVIEVLLTKDGHFSKAYILQSSGDRRLDLLPFEAFRSAAPFINPPKGLVDPDGMIRIRYAFFIQFRPPNFGPDIN